MPTVAIIDGVKIQFFFADHDPPHFHVDFAGDQAQIRIDTLEMMEGSLPASKLRTVREWAGTRRQQLEAAWELAAAGNHPGKIA